MNPQANQPPQAPQPPQPALQLPVKPKPPVNRAKNIAIGLPVGFVTGTITGFQLFHSVVPALAIGILGAVGGVIFALQVKTDIAKVSGTKNPKEKYGQTLDNINDIDTVVDQFK